MDDAAFAEALAMARFMRAGLQPEMIQSAALPGRPRDTPPPRPATPPTGPPPSTLEEIGQALHRYENSRPRSVQKTLGPSELGTPCDRQIALKLAGVARRDMGLAWAPMCGTAVHGLMEDVLRAENARLGRERWIIEQKLFMGGNAGDNGIRDLRGTDADFEDPDLITGHGDAYDCDHDMVVDWKYTGITARRKAQRRSVPNEELVSMEYRTQAHLYGLGHHNAGRPVQFVRLVLLARSHDYSESVEWTEEYREDIAVDALTRFYAIRDQVVNLDAARLPERLQWIDATPGDACKWCPFLRRSTTPDQLSVDATGCEGNYSEIDARKTPWM